MDNYLNAWLYSNSSEQTKHIQGPRSALVVDRQSACKNVFLHFFFIFQTKGLVATGDSIPAPILNLRITTRLCPYSELILVHTLT